MTCWELAAGGWGQLGASAACKEGLSWFPAHAIPHSVKQEGLHIYVTTYSYFLPCSAVQQ